MGYGSVYKLSGNRRRPWIVRLTVGWSEDGKQLYKILGYFKTRKEAQIALAEYHNNPYDVDLRKLTFREVFERWAEEHYPKISQSKRNAYKTVFNQSEAIHDVPISQIKTMHLQALINEKKHLRASTLGHHKSAYSQVFKYAIKNEIAAKNYAEYIDIPNTVKKKQKQVFTRAEIDTLFSYHEVGVPDVDIVLILIFTGFRIMELLKMKKENVNLAERYMVGGSKTDAGRNRVVPISRKIHGMLEDRMSGESEYLFPSPKGCVQIYQNFRPNVWIPLMEKMGMKHTAHDTRHTFISLMTDAGVEKIITQRIAGHSNKDVTDHYTHLEIRKLIEAIDKI